MPTSTAVTSNMTLLWDFTVKGASGAETSLDAYKGSVVLVVNTASKCGLAPQFEGLQALNDAYGDKGFTVLGFPCGQFAHQEFDEQEKTMEFCQVNYSVTFPMFAKIDVNGRGADPLYKWLKASKKDAIGSAIKWNFTKFLVGKDGTVIARYAPTHAPADIAADIEAALAA